jgi:hypothetical protein
MLHALTPLISRTTQGAVFMATLAAMRADRSVISMNFVQRRCTAAELQRCQMVRTVRLQTTKACNSKTWNIQSRYLINAVAILGFGVSFNVRWPPHSQFVDENASTIRFKVSQGLVASHLRKNRRFIRDTSKAFFSSPQPLLSGSGFHPARKKATGM